MNISQNILAVNYLKKKKQIKELEQRKYHTLKTAAGKFLCFQLLVSKDFELDLVSLGKKLERRPDSLSQTIMIYCTNQIPNRPWHMK
jgi:hypothetical protein